MHRFTLDPTGHTAALAYAALRRRYDRSGGPMRSWRDRSGLSDEAWQATKRDHARLIRAAGAERIVLDRLCLDDDAPLSSEVERVRAALERLAVVWRAAQVLRPECDQCQPSSPPQYHLHDGGRH